MERVEALVGRFVSGPVHLGIDSTGAISMIRNILQNTFDLQRKPRPLRHDGDVGEALQQAIEAEGRHAIRATWTKGYATSQHRQEGILLRKSYLNDFQGSSERSKNRRGGQKILSNCVLVARFTVDTPSCGRIPPNRLLWV